MQPTLRKPSLYTHDLLLRLPFRLNGSFRRLLPPQLPVCSGIFHCPSGPRSVLQGTLFLLSGKAPDVTALRDPEHPPFPSVIPLRALLVPRSLLPAGLQTGYK